MNKSQNKFIKQIKQQIKVKKVFSNTYHIWVSAGRLRSAVTEDWKRTACTRAKQRVQKLFYSSVGKSGVCVSAEQGALRVTFS